MIPAAHLRRALAAAAFVLIGAATTAAQAPSDSQGPLVLTPISSTVVFSPDVKATKVDGKTATLAGLYAAKVIESKVLVGGAGYWLTDPRQDARLWYAGALLGWRALGDRHVTLDARVLGGAGQGTIYRQVTTFARPDFRRDGDPQPAAIERRFGYRDDFMVAEPQVVLGLAVVDRVRVNVGAGYRLTTAREGLNELFRGATGSIGVEFDLGN